MTLTQERYETIIKDYFPEKVLEDSDLSIKYCKRADMILHHYNESTLRNWEKTNHLPQIIDKMELALALQIFYLTNNTQWFEDAMARKDNAAITSESMGSHSVTKALMTSAAVSNPNFVRMNVFNTPCPDSVDIIVYDLGWGDFKVGGEHRRC